jgi:hypothetical protein
MRPFPIGDSPLTCMQHPYSESTNRASYVDPFCGGGRYNNPHGVEAKRREMTNPRRRRIYSNAKRRRNVLISEVQRRRSAETKTYILYQGAAKQRRNVSIMTKQSAETVKCRNMKRSAERRLTRYGSVYTLMQSGAGTCR